MSKKAFKSHASSSRAVSGAFGGDGPVFGDSTTTPAFGAVSSSPLSYVYEPPDLTAFSDPNIVVAFKNLQKKDGTTKAKALEDLQAYVSSLGAETGGVEEVMLTAWVGQLGRKCAWGSQHVDVAIDEIIPALIHRFLTSSTSTCSYSARAVGNFLRQTNGETYAYNCCLMGSRSI